MMENYLRKTRHAIDIPGHAHAFTFSCYHRHPLLSKDRSRRWVVEALEQAREKYDVAIWAYVIMPDHMHLLFGPLGESCRVAEILKSVKQPVARRAVNFLRKNSSGFLDVLRVSRPDGRVEHRFWQQGGGYDRNLVSADAVRATIEYFHDNPVRRGLVKVTTDWNWSSARFYAGAQDVPLVPDRPCFI